MPESGTPGSARGAGRKARPTFADTLAAVRRHLWAEQGLRLSWRRSEATKLRPALRHGIAYALCHAA